MDSRWITNKISLVSHPIYSKDILTVLPWIISKVPDGDVKNIIQSQMLDKRTKMCADFIVLSLASLLEVVNPQSLGHFQKRMVTPLYQSLVFTTRDGRRSDATRRAVT